jgi:hypothetical protein
MNLVKWSFHSIIWGTIPMFVWREWEKPWKTSVMLVLSAEVRIQNLLNTKQHYCPFNHNIQFSFFRFVLMWNMGPSLLLGSIYLRLVLLLVSSFFHPSVVPILLFFSRLFLVYPSSWYPKGFSLVHVIVPCSLRNVFPFCCYSVGVCSVFCHNSSFWMLSSHLMLKIYCRHQCTNTWSELLNHLVIFQWSLVTST